MSIHRDILRFLKFNRFWATRSDFYNDLAQAIEDKELLRDFVEGEALIAESPLTRNKAKATALAIMRDLMRDGANSIYEVVGPVMPRSDEMGLTVVRDAKEPVRALRSLAANVEEQKSMTKIVRASAASPAMLLPVGFGFSYVLATTSIPAFEKAAPPEVWVGFAGLVRDVANFIAMHGLTLFAITMIVGSWFIFWGLANITSRWRYSCEHSYGAKALPWVLLWPLKPLLMLYRDIQSSRMLSDLSVYLRNGLGLQDAVSNLAAGSSPWMRQHLEWVIEHLQMSPGDYIGAFSHGILSRTMLSRLHSMVRRDAGQDFAQVLVKVGTTGQEKAREDIKKAAARGNFVLLTLTLSLVMFFYVGQSWIVFQIQQENSPSAIQMRAAKKSKGGLGSATNSLPSTNAQR